ncbi:hypothetical protein TrVFT333_006862 [Trichoderma virens FT-333]|nr:hypothetical protein TrVFT333_006862 [Trichoderma virens FT-333]
MASRNMRQNPVFQKLEEIQRYTDVCPNPQDSDFETCRAKRVDEVASSESPRCFRPVEDRTDNRWIHFKTTSSCAARLVVDLKTKAYTICAINQFIQYTTNNCSCTTACTLDAYTIHTIISHNTTFASSLPNTPLRNGTRSRFDIEDVTEEESTTEDIPEGDVIAEENIDEEAPVPKEVLEQEVLVAEEVVQGIIVFPNVKQEHGDERMRDLAFTAGIKEDISERQDTIIKGLGVTGIQRSGSIRDHSPVFQVISSHPTADKMREGVVYILQHKENASLFKIGWSKCFKCQGGHREWFIAPRETVRETVMHVEEFLQMPAYTLQDGEYKLSSEAYDHVVKKMCDFSVIRLGELMHARKTPEETETSSDALIDNVMTPLAQLTDEPAEISHLNTSNRLSEIQEVNKSFVSTSSRDTKPQQLSAGAKLARKVKRLFSVGDSVKGYLFRPREPKPEPEDDTKRPFSSVFADLKDKAREAGTKVRHDAREFRRDFKEELRRKSEEQTS